MTAPCSGDLTPRDLAQRVVDGFAVSSAAHVDIARALLELLADTTCRRSVLLGNVAHEMFEAEEIDLPTLKAIEFGRPDPCGNKACDACYVQPSKETP